MCNIFILYIYSNGFFAVELVNSILKPGRANSTVRREVRSRAHLNQKVISLNKPPPNIVERPDKQQHEFGAGR